MLPKGHAKDSLENIRMEVWGERAIFTRPEFKVERYSYDTITPSAARNILQQIYWHPAMQYEITAITVFNPIRRQVVTRNELDVKLSSSQALKSLCRAAESGVLSPVSVRADQMRQQRSTAFLCDVHYAIEAKIRASKNCSTNETFDICKYRGIFYDRLYHGQCYRSPYLGIREFPAYCAPRRYDTNLVSAYEGTTVDLGIMLYDIDYKDHARPYFFHPFMVDGRIEIPSQKEVMGNAAFCAE